MIIPSTLVDHNSLKRKVHYDKRTLRRYSNWHWD